MADLLNSLKFRFKSGNITLRLVYINVALFLIVALIGVVFKLFKLNHLSLTPWFAMPSNPAKLLTHIWTLITYMFFHERFFHLLFNMLMLFWFGQIFSTYYSEKQLLSLYLFGGLMGAAFFFVMYNTLPLFSTPNAIGISMNKISLLMGASGSIIAILVASAMRAPNMEMRLLLLGNVKLKWIALVLVGMSLFGMTSHNAGGEMAHLGGAFAGYLFIVSNKKGKDITFFIQKFISFIVNLFKKKPKKAKVKYHAQRMSPEEYNQSKANNEKEIDRILDKIKASGYESLSSDEKKRLFEQKK